MQCLNFIYLHSADLYFLCNLEENNSKFHALKTFLMLRNIIQIYISSGPELFCINMHLLLCSWTGRTPLIFAVHSENAVVVKYLLDNGADPDKADDDGLAPLHSAAGIGPLYSFVSLFFKCAPWFLSVLFLFVAYMWPYCVPK